MLNPESQLRLPLGGENPYSPDYFVLHSGVVHALETLRAARSAEGFSFFVLTGPRGSGRTHLLEVLRSENGASTLEIFDEPIDWSRDESVRAFIDSYERLKSDGGVLVCAGEAPGNPHVASRFSLAHPLAINFPADEELRPLVAAILERRGLRLPDSQLDYLLERLPASPLSLSDIFAKIDRLSLALGKSPNRALFRSVLAGKE